MEGHDMDSMPGTDLPKACMSGHAPTRMDMGDQGGMGEGMPEHGRRMMEGMMRMHGPMMQGMAAEDPDLAFACAMIPHH